MSSDENSRQSAYEKALAVKRVHQDTLLAKANVVGVGIGLRQQGGERGGDVALIVMVKSKVPEDELAPEDIVPEEIDGVPVEVQEVGDIRAQ
jgi:hypothetical protein